MNMKQQTQWNIGYWIVAMLSLLALQGWWRAQQQVEPVPYSEFESDRGRPGSRGADLRPDSHRPYEGARHRG